MFSMAPQAPLRRQCGGEPVQPAGGAHEELRLPVPAPALPPVPVILNLPPADHSRSSVPVFLPLPPAVSWRGPASRASAAAACPPATRAASAGSTGTAGQGAGRPRSPSRAGRATWAASTAWRRRPGPGQRRRLNWDSLDFVLPATSFPPQDKENPPSICTCRHGSSGLLVIFLSPPRTGTYRTSTMRPAA